MYDQIDQMHSSTEHEFDVQPEEALNTLSESLEGTLEAFRQITHVRASGLRVRAKYDQFYDTVKLYGEGEYVVDGKTKQYRDSQTLLKKRVTDHRIKSILEGFSLEFNRLKGVYV